MNITPSDNATAYDHAVHTLHSHTILFADIVESTRLIEDNEAAIYSNWRKFLKVIDENILPKNQGRIVRSLGDGFIAIFDTSFNAIEAAFAIRSELKQDKYNSGLASPIMLRMGLDSGDFVEDKHDVYGRSAMIAARLMSIAGPNEILVSANVCDKITPNIDADIEDLGECYLKHVRQPVRAFRLGHQVQGQEIKPVITPDELRPTIAIIPFGGTSVSPEQSFIGEILSEKITAGLSISIDANIISRLSTSRLQGRGFQVDNYRRILNADYVMCGHYHINDNKLHLRMQLVEADSEKVLWSTFVTYPVDSIFSDDQEVVRSVVNDICNALLQRTREHVFTRSLNNLQNYTLLMGAISLMHRLSPIDFNKSQELLLELVKRATRISEPYAWLANWHVLRVQQGWSQDPKKDGQLALEYSKQALDNNPSSSIALAIDGFVHTNLLRRFDVSEKSFEMALEANSNNALAWLLQGTLKAFKGEGNGAVSDTEKAISLSPIDPHRFFYESLTSTAYLAADDYENALIYANRSYRLNRTHTSTLRVKAAALWNLDRHQEARATTKELLALEPELTVSGWLERSPSADYPIGKRWAEVLTKVGVPR